LWSKKKLKITKLDLMLVNEFMINCRFTTHSKKERNQGFQDGYHKWPMHGSHYTQPNTSLLHNENNNTRVTKVEEAPTTKHKEEEEGNDKGTISCTYHSLCFNEVLYKTLT